MPPFPPWAGGRGPRRGAHYGDEPVRPRRVHRLVEPALLLLLREGPMHGYGLMSGLRNLGLENYPVDPSAIYRMLRDLEHGGAVVSAWDQQTTAGPPKRVYSITELGERMLATWVENLRRTSEVLQGFLKAYDERTADRRGALRKLLRRLATPDTAPRE